MFVTLNLLLDSNVYLSDLHKLFIIDRIKLFFSLILY